jgi:hypothetical protein
MVIHRTVTRLTHSNIAAYFTFSSSDILFYISSKYMHWTHCTSKWCDVWMRYKGLNPVRHFNVLQTYWGALRLQRSSRTGYSGHLVAFIMPRFCTHWQQETLFVSFQTLSKVVICYYCHLCTKTCDHTHTEIMKLHTFSVILHFSWQTDTWRWMLLTPQHNVCVCVCLCVHAHLYITCKHLKVIREDHRPTAGNLLLPVSM